MELRDKLAQIALGLGYEFVGIEQRPHLLRVYIDKEGGITVGDCSKVSRQVSALLDVEDPISENYTLEVSSPGLNRPLFVPAHYQKYLSRLVKLRVRELVQNRRNFTGVLLLADEKAITLLLENDEKVVLPFSIIESANLIEDIEIKKKGVKK